MSLYVRQKSNIIESRAIPMHGIELYGGAGDEDLHLQLRSLMNGSSWSLEEIRKKDDQYGSRVIAYRINAVGQAIYNNWGDVEYAKQFEKIGFSKIVDCNIWLQAHEAQGGRGVMYVSNKNATVRHWDKMFKIPSQQGFFPKLVVEVKGLFSIDAVKGYTERLVSNPEAIHFFDQGW